MSIEEMRTAYLEARKQAGIEAIEKAKTQGLTQTELAALVGCSPSYITMVKNGKKLMTVEMLKRLQMEE